MGDPEWAKDRRFDDTPGRLEHHDELDERLTQWTASRSAQDVMQTLQEHSVPAGVVQRSSDLQKDPQLAHRKFFRQLDHPDMGEIPYGGHQFRIAGYDSGPRFPAPMLGQHTDQVLREILGMTDDEITEAVIAGALE